MGIVVAVSDTERAAGRLSAATEQTAREVLGECGCVLLRGVFTPAAVDALRSEFDAQWGRLDATMMAAQANMPPPNPVLCVGKDRYEILVKMKGALGDPHVFGNLLLCKFLTRVLDETLKLSGVTVVVSYPGAETQHVHSDLHPLFAEPGLSASLPSYAINVAVPLVDVKTNMGPTGIWLGSHRWSRERAPLASECACVEYLRGDCILIDYRTLHAGLPNKSDGVRPILYMVYARTWFFDEANHRARPSLDLAVSDFMKLPTHLKALTMRTYSQQMRAQYLTSMTEREKDGS